MRSELALVCGDGGIKGGFIAGVVTALLKKFPDEMLKVKTIAASSASVGSMFYFISHGLKHPGEQIWKEDLGSKKFISYGSIRSIYAKRPIYDIDYLVYEVFKRQHPLNISAINASPIEFYFPVQNYETEEVEYFANRPNGFFVRGDKLVRVHDFRNYDIYDVIRAANSAPFVYDRPTKIGDQLYIDAATLEPYVLDLPVLRGKKKLVVVSKADFSWQKNLAYYLSGYVWPLAVNPFKQDRLKASIYRQYARKPDLLRRLQDAAEIAQALGDLLFFAPIEKIGGNMDNSLQTLRNNFRHGENIVDLRIDEIKEFMAR